MENSGNGSKILNVATKNLSIALSCLISTYVIRVNGKNPIEVGCSVFHGWLSCDAPLCLIQLLPTPVRSEKKISSLRTKASCVVPCFSVNGSCDGNGHFSICLFFILSLSLHSLISFVKVKRRQLFCLFWMQEGKTDEGKILNKTRVASQLQAAARLNPEV